MNSQSGSSSCLVRSPMNGQLVIFREDKRTKNRNNDPSPTIIIAANRQKNNKPMRAAAAEREGPFFCS